MPTISIAAGGTSAETTTKANNILKLHIGASTPRLSGDVNISCLPNLENIQVLDNDVNSIIGFSNNTTLTAANFCDNNLIGNLDTDFKITNKPNFCCLILGGNKITSPYSSFPTHLKNLNISNMCSISGNLPTPDSNNQNICCLESLFMNGSIYLSGYIPDISPDQKYLIAGTYNGTNISNSPQTHHATIVTTAMPQNLKNNSNIISFNTTYTDMTGAFNPICDPLDMKCLPNIEKLQIGYKTRSNAGNPFIFYCSTSTCKDKVSNIPTFPLYGGPEYLTDVKMVGFYRNRNGAQRGGSKFGLNTNMGIMGDPLSGHKWTTGPRLTNIDFSTNRFNGFQTLNILSGVYYSALKENITGGTLNLCGNFFPKKFNCNLPRTCICNQVCLYGTPVGEAFFGLKCDLGWTIKTFNGTYWGATSQIRPTDNFNNGTGSGFPTVPRVYETPSCFGVC